MNDIRLFIRRNSKEEYKMSIKYEDNETIYKYKYPSFILTFKEDLNNENIILSINKKNYENLTDIHLFLFNLFDYKNFEYIDLFLKQQIEKSTIIIEDYYNDNYDDFNNEFIAIRNLIFNKKIFKLKFVLKNNEFYLYYKDNTIIGFDNIIEKIIEIIQLIMNSDLSS